MIRVEKPPTPPARLRNAGKSETAKLNRAYNRAPAHYRDGRKKFEFKSSIYGHATVKRALLRAQYDKCAFCEARITHVSYGDVEHFRPKGGYRQKRDDDLGRPGYYWLAYQWSNLFASCQICNQRFKKNLFPLSNPSRRARSHHDSVEAEKPRLIDPSEEKTEELIGFREEYAFPIRNSTRARATIEVLGLNREELAEDRRTRLRLLAPVLDSLRLLRQRHPAGSRPPDVQQHLETLLQHLEEATLASAEYASMSRAIVGQLGD